MASPVCEKIVFIKPDGTPHKEFKKKYNTFESAVEAAKQINNKPNQIHKVVAYKCSICLRFHVGKSKFLIKKLPIVVG